MISRRSSILVAMLIAALTGCSSSPPSRYSIDQDHGPRADVDLSHVPDAVPRVEPKSRGGNKSPYTVWGKKYAVLDSAAGYRERGVSSWYGKKFHGHRTSNGEVYDMYGMSAAHKSLPLPSYVRVTNLDNGKQVVVRVNDRGPFHGARLIDLSYAAAFKLDMLQRGTARVEVEVITVAVSDAGNSGGYEPAPVQNMRVGSHNRFIQVGAYSSQSAAESVKTRLGRLLVDQQVEVSTREAGSSIYRVRLGPLSAAGTSVEGLLSLLADAGFGDSQVLDLP